jgi:carbamoyl-phosphate synthase large subunit
VIILGGGPNRIGQGIEFDYCCVHAAIALRELGYETVMVNCNPETVSTDYDTSDRLYFEPLTLEDVLNVVDRAPARRDRAVRRPDAAQPRARPEDAGVPISAPRPTRSTAPRTASCFSKLITELGIASRRTAWPAAARRRSRSRDRIGYPVLVRPSYVLGGRAMEIVYDAKACERYMDRHRGSRRSPAAGRQVPRRAIEVDVDAIADGTAVVIGGIMEHIEEAGIHSGDSSLLAAALHAVDGLIERSRKTALALASSASSA